MDALRNMTVEEVRERASGSVRGCPFCGGLAYVALVGTTDRPYVAACWCGARADADYGAYRLHWYSVEELAAAV
jgi:rhodanese-related sulfurtransferase